MTKDKIYDGELLFKTWCAWGQASNHDRLIEFAGKDHPKGKASQMGPYYAMWRWAFSNPEKAFEYWKEWWFLNYPDREPAKFEDFLLVLRERGKGNNSVANTKRLERFCARYNLPYDFKVFPGDVIQVTKKNSHLFQKLLFVEGIEEQFISAYFLFPDETRSNHELKIGEFGVIGRSIV